MGRALFSKMVLDIKYNFSQEKRVGILVEGIKETILVERAQCLVHLGSINL